MVKSAYIREQTILRAVDQLPALIGYWDAHERNVFANQAYGDYFGLRPPQILGMHIRDVLGTALYEANRRYIEGALAGTQQQFERVLVDVAGVSRTTQATYRPDVVDGDVVGFTVLVVDVSDRAEAERQRDGAKRLFEVAMENAPIGKAILTRNGSILQANRALCDLVGYTRDELRELTLRDLVHPEEVSDSDAQLAALMDGSVHTVACERRYIRQDGATIWVQRNATLVRDTQYGDVIIAQVQDITERRLSTANLAREALFDHLTGLGNRRHLMAAITSVSPSSQDWPMGILFVDIDDFKAINDTHGHDFGDRVLVEVARRLCENVRAVDLACRYGGDEFVVVVRQVNTPEDVRHLAERVAASVQGDYCVGDVTVMVTASVGWSFDPDSSVEYMLKSADARMYDAKMASPE
ncbi:MAG: diguanylate cyclase [Rhodococcus sp. (in: high G+C Gram-positive bacteria)]